MLWLKVSTPLLLFQLLWFGCSCQRNVSIVHDIWNAFRGITNDSALLDHIIPEMYGPSMLNANPSFIFKMPTAERDTFQLLTMRRSEFVDPTFPNITRGALPTTSGSHVKTSLAVAPAGEWQQLGLDGWTGELKQPESWLEQTHKDTEQQQQQQLPGAGVPIVEYPREHITLDLQKQQLNGRVTDIRVLASNQEEAQLEDLMNVNNVYIARSNDPFGYSMKWGLSTDSSMAEPNDRGKRDVAKLYSMIKCSTKCDPLIYKGYGCYCGFGGQGVATDGIDQCCRLHDKCYGQSNCISYLEYFVPYVWKCYRGKPLCAIDHGEWGGPDSCAARLCQCDLRLSRCLRRFYCPRKRAVCHSSRARRLQNLIFFD